MKKIVLIIVIFLPAVVFAKDYKITGSEARIIMEAMTGAEFEVSNINNDWSTVKSLDIDTGPILCKYYAYDLPDDWMSFVNCFKGTVASGAVLKNSLSVVRAIQKYAFFDAGMGKRWLSVENVSCSFDYKKTEYICTVSADEFLG